MTQPVSTISSKIFSLVAVFAALIISACSPAGTDQPPELSETSATTGAASSEKLQLPEPTGPYPIGVVDFELIDQHRDETFNPGHPRRIPVRAWFPAESVRGEPRLFATAEEMKHVIRGFSRVIPMEEAAIKARENLPTHAYEQATPLNAGPLPTVIFSHGGFAYLQSNTSLMEHLASHGYLVLSITHPYISSATLHENGDIVPADQSLIDGMMSSSADPTYLAAFVDADPAVRLEAQLRNNETFVLAPHFLIWEQDYSHVVDRLAAGDVPPKAKPLLPLFDNNRLGAFGMSFGASGSAAAHKDSRFKAAVNLDGGVFDSALYDVDVRIPVLVFHSDSGLAMPGQKMYPFSEFVYERLETAGTRDDVIRIETKGSTHGCHTDGCLTPESIRRAYPAVAASLGTIDGQRMVLIMNTFVQRFFDRYLSGQGSGQGTGLDAAFRAQFPEVVDVDLAAVREMAAGHPAPGFMSYTHVFTMNRLLAADADTKAAAAALDRKYVMAFELTDAPGGGTQWWLMNFDPENGLSFSLQPPESTPDVTYTGDYAEYIRFMQRMVAGEVTEDQEPVTTSGNANLMQIIGAAFAAGNKAAAIKTVFPDV